MPALASVQVLWPPPLQSPQDKKRYRGLTLDNGLSVLLISDPEMRSQSGGQGGGAAAEGAPRQPSQARGGRRRTKAADHEDEGSAEEDEDEEDEEEDGSESGSGEEEVSDEGDSDDDSGSDEDDEDEDEEEEEEEGSEGGKRGGKRGKGKGKGGGGGAAEGVKKAAAAMVVGVGSFSDPECMQGLSHYLEHMLFMGSAGFPNENEFDDYMTKYSGSSNAFTELELTNFHFEVAPEALRGALERFSQFFTAPLMLSSSLEREVLAVDSEFSGVMQSDACRVSQLMCHTARPGHPYRQFSWGNKKSLWDQPLAAGLDIRQHIQDYYKKHYSAERMNLVLLGGEDLDTLQAWVLELFAELPTGCGPRPSIAHAPMPFQGRQVYVMPAVRDNHEVSITFQLPCLWERYLCKAEHYVAHLLGHEGPGSLLSLLKAKGWATEVTAGIDEDGYSQNSRCFLFTVTVSLTDAGLAAAPGCGLAPLEATFGYLRMLREAGPQEWVWREMAQIAEMKFRFQEDEEPMDACTRLAGGLHLCKPQHVLAHEYLHEQYDPGLISEVLSCMDPSQSEYRIDVLTRQYERVKEQLATLVKQQDEGAGGGVTVDTEPWFNMEAAWAQVPASLVQAWATSPPPPELRLPPPNPYIATDFTVHLPTDPAPGVSEALAKSADAAQPTAAAAAAAAEVHEAAALAQELQLPLVLATPPTMVLDQPGLRVWHKLDRSFALPRANVCLRLSSPTWCAGAREAALTHLALKVMEDCLTEDAYLAEVAGLHYSTAPEGMTGVEVKVNGFTHKLSLLAKRVLDTLAAATFEGSSWETVHEASCRKYRNMNMQVAKHASYERLHALCAAAMHHTQLLPHAQSATLADVRAHVQQALRECHLEVLVHGNMTQSEALALARDTHSALGPGCTMAPGSRKRDCCVEVPVGRGLLLQHTTRNAEEENCGVEVYFQVGRSASPLAAERALLDLVDQMAYEPAYNSLRTKQQLGYTVHTGTRLTHGVLGFCVVVVSASHTAAQVDERVDAFLSEFGDKLREMTDTEFEQHKTSLRSNKLTKDRNLADETTRHWDHIWNQRYDFLAREAEVAVLEGVTLQQVREWWDKHLHPASPARRKLSVHIVPTKACLAAGTTTATNGSNGTHHGDAPAPAAAAAAGADGKASKATKPAAKRQKSQATQPPAAPPAAPAARVVDDVEQLKRTLPLIASLVAEPPPSVRAATAAALGRDGGAAAMDCS